MPPGGLLHICITFYVALFQLYELEGDADLESLRSRIRCISLSIEGPVEFAGAFLDRDDVLLEILVVAHFSVNYLVMDSGPDFTPI